MTIHCFDVIYSPNASMDSYLSSWLTSWSAWEPEPHEEPGALQFSDLETGNTVDAAGFRQNRFTRDNIDNAIITDADVQNNQVILDTDVSDAVEGGERFQLRRSDGSWEIHEIVDWSTDGKTLELKDLSAFEGQTLNNRNNQLVDSEVFFSQYIVSNLIGQNGYCASYCDWWIVRAHTCDHDEDNGSGCGNWFVIDSSSNYSGQTDVPSEVPQ